MKFAINSKTRPKPIKLRFSQKQFQVMVEPEDKDRFVISVEEAIKACRMYDNRKEFKNQLEIVEKCLGKWFQNRKDKIHKAFLTLQDTVLLFLVIRKQVKYDDSFEEELTQLDIDIAHNANCNDIHLNVLALPLCDVESYISFCDPSFTLEFAESDA